MKAAKMTPTQRYRMNFSWPLREFSLKILALPLNLEAVPLKAWLYPSISFS